MPDALASMWRRVRLELLKLAEGRTARLDKGSPPAEPDRTPPAAGQDLRYFDRRWENAKTDDKRRKVIKEAVDFLELHQPKPDTRHRRGTFDWKLAIASDPRPSRTVGRMYRVSPQTVCNYRDELGIKEAV